MKVTIAFFSGVLSTFCWLPNAQALSCEPATKGTQCIEVTIKDKQGLPVPDMVVYLQPTSGQKLPITDKVVTVRQENKAFSPYLTVSQTEKAVNFVNQDDITHHIYSVNSDNKFAFKIRAGEHHMTEHFHHEAEIAMACNLHDWMSGYLLVVNTPYFAKTDEKGHAFFAVNQTGNYNSIVWHPQLPVKNNRLVKKISIHKPTRIDFVLPKPLDPIPTQENNDSFDFDSDY